MLTCHICLSSLEGSAQPPVCIPSCGHVFHHDCILRWSNVNQSQTCPKCRAEMGDTNKLIKLYFGQGGNSCANLLLENQMCRKKIDFLLQEVNENLKIIDANTKELVASMSHQEEKNDDKDNDAGAFQLKNLAVLLSRAEETKRIQEYYDSVNN